MEEDTTLIYNFWGVDRGVGWEEVGGAGGEEVGGTLVGM